MAVSLKMLMEKAVHLLTVAGVYAPEAEAEKLIACTLGCVRSELKPKLEQPLSEDALQRYAQLMARRCAREPLSRIIGEIDVADVKIKLAPHVFEPMAESEALIHHAAIRGEGKTLRVLDIGTGTGVLLLGVLKALPLATGVGVDSNASAIELANENARLNGLQTRACFFTGDLIDPCNEKFDLILTNLPFVPRHLVARLMPEVRDHDPLDALDGGKDGLAVYRRLLKTIARVQGPNTLWLALSSVKALSPMRRLFTAAGYRDIQVVPSNYGIPVGLVLKGPARPSWLTRLVGV